MYPGDHLDELQAHMGLPLESVFPGDLSDELLAQTDLLLEMACPADPWNT